MNANELRIGNLVTDEWFESFKTIITVESVNDKGINLVIEDDGKWLEIAQHFIVPEYTFDKLRGIPLTEEWLLKFGFEKDKNVEYFYNKELLTISLPTELNKPKGRVYFNSWAIIEEMPKYVHQIQNLYFALTGTELTSQEDY